MNICFIGGGNMASAMIGGLLAQGRDRTAIRVVEIAQPARDRLEREFGVTTTAGIAAGVADAECVVLAVKPQQMREVAAELKAQLDAQLVVSIAAGIRCADLSRWLGGYPRIVRVMPNTPALMRSGVSGLYAMPGVRAEDRTRAESILAAVGATLWLEREEQIDAVTAVSGSGPAYVFYFVEALAHAAQELGFSAEQARQLSLNTFAGAVALATHTGEDPALLRARVTSKGGTTERAIGVMEAQAVKQVIVRAVCAAAQRSREIGDEFGKL